MRGAYEATHRLRGKVAVLKDCMPAENGLHDFACQSASAIRGVFVAIMEVLLVNFEGLLQIHDSQVCIHPLSDLAFSLRQAEALRHIPAYESAEERQSDTSLNMAFGDQERESMLDS